MKSISAEEAYEISEKAKNKTLQQLYNTIDEKIFAACQQGLFSVKINGELYTKNATAITNHYCHELGYHIKRPKSMEIKEVEILWDV